MANKKYEVNINEVKITGIIEEAPVYSHTVFGEDFYTAVVMVKRDNSDARDMIPVVISDKLINCKELDGGTVVTITGQFRSFNKIDPESERRHLILSVFCKDITIMDPENSYYENSIKLSGYICKKPIFRKTPMEREISDVMLAVNRAYGKSDYIPCIAWGRNAKFTSNMKIGTYISLSGRIQSRTYNKKVATEDGSFETEERTVYEVSIFNVNIVDKDEKVSDRKDDDIIEEAQEAYDID